MPANLTQPAHPTPLILYDGTCSTCQAGARRFGPLLRRRGFRLETLQSDVARSLINDAIDEMKVVTTEGRVLGGADALAYILRHIWWAFPLVYLWWMPPLRPVFRRLYAWVAAHRNCLGGQCRRPNPPPGRPT